MSRFVCIHGHFYQPPRENPWFEQIEVQDSAYPYHDWNERITEECYAPNTAARILDEHGLITRIVNNYSMISFNAGPTLLSWMEQYQEDVYDAILRADKIGSERFGGHGPAIAQCYNHMIMPLANRRDKKTQIRWGILDFIQRFDREPEGMWLPELAVDLETLRFMAAEGIRFTILEPHQIARLRSGDGAWLDSSGGWIDPGKPYRVDLGDGDEIALFINNVSLAHEVAFGPLLRDGNLFSSRIITAFDERNRDQLVHFAVDGETYGHHYRFGEMALAYCLSRLQEEDIALTVYGHYLASHPPLDEVEIKEKTSWSCPHTLSRWMGGCTCSTGGHPGWSLEWRRYLRSALDHLRDQLNIHFEEVASGLFHHPWTARNDYIRVVSSRTEEAKEAFLTEHGSHLFTPEEGVKALELLEMQRHLMLMYTSCGWFFDDIAGIEAVQVMSYAARAIQLYHATGGAGAQEDEIQQFLQAAESNTPGFSDGASVWRGLVAPRVTDLQKVCGQYALTSLFCSYPATSRHTIYEVTRFLDEQQREERRRITLGAATIRSLLTNESKSFVYAAAHPGGHQLLAGVAPFNGEEEYVRLRDTILSVWREEETKSLHDECYHLFGDGCIQLSDLLRDEARGIVGGILHVSVDHIEETFRIFYNTYIPLVLTMKGLDMPIPQAMMAPIAYVLNTDLICAIEAEIPNPDDINRLLGMIQQLSVIPEGEKLSYVAGLRLRDLIQRLLTDPEDIRTIGSITAVMDLVTGLTLHPSLWGAQNAFIHLRDTQLSYLRKQSLHDGRYRLLVGKIEEIGRLLGVKL
jgi:alpha-amylase/alpha-mannosidase (GH57 family)